jgi:thiosulfate dehydrogenase (quinone) large subunit
MVELVRKKEVEQNWLVRHSASFKTASRVIFGLVWLIDGSLKFAPGLVNKFPGMVTSAGQGQPAWLHPWFSFWAAQAAAHPAFWVYSTGSLELALAFCLIFGFLRKIAYLGGIFLSLLIWAVPEGFGGPYGPGATDIGTGVVYALLFLALIVLNASFGPSRSSLDYYIEERWPRWGAVAEFQKLVPTEDNESLPIEKDAHPA